MKNGLPTIDQTTRDLNLQRIVSDFSLNTSSNILNAARYSEDLSWAYHIVSNTALKTGQTQWAYADNQHILFSRITGSNFFAKIDSRYVSAALTPFIAGQKYLISLYAYSALGQWFWMRELAGSSDFGHGAKYAKPGKISRHHILVEAVSTSQVDSGGSPILELGAGAAAHPCLAFQGSAATLDLWVGGIQIEAVPNDTKDGIALIGDSTMAGSSGGKDLPRDYAIPSNYEVSTILAAELNTTVFNRAVGGETLGDMDARWAAGITVLAPRCKYVIIQGGINDISQGRSLAQMQSSIQSMVAKANTDGLIPVILNCTPFAAATADSAMETKRIDFNDWLSTTYGSSVIDINSKAVSPYSTNALHPAGFGDGTHYSWNIKKLIGEYVARSSVWDFESPSTYSRNDPYTAGSWGAVNRAVPIDKSGSITAGGVAQTAIASNPNRRDALIQNVSDEVMWISELTTAVQGSPSIQLSAGEKFYLSAGGCNPTSAISIIAATTGKKYTAREYL